MRDVRLENWGEAVVATLCLPALLGSLALPGAYAGAGNDLTLPLWIAGGLVWFVTLSPVLLVTGAIMVCTGAALTPWLPGRRHVKYSSLVATTVLWVVGWALLVTPGLSELP